MIRPIVFQDCVSTETCRAAGTVVKVITPKGVHLASVHASPGIARGLVCDLIAELGETVEIPDESPKGA